MESFAKRYTECHPNVFTSSDTAYVLAFSVIMLNTDAHSNQIVNKMTQEEFLRNNRGIGENGGAPIARAKPGRRLMKGIMDERHHSNSNHDC